MSNYFELHSLELKSNESSTHQTKEKSHENSNVKELKEKIVSAEKTKKKKSKLFKIKVMVLLCFSHALVYLFALTLQTDPVNDNRPKELIPTVVEPDEVLLSLSLVLFSNFQKSEKAKWVDLYTPTGNLIVKKIVILKKDSSEDDFDPSSSYPTNHGLPAVRHYDVIVKKKDAPLLLSSVQKNYHALPHGIEIPQNQKMKMNKPVRSLAPKKRDPFEKPWSL